MNIIERINIEVKNVLDEVIHIRRHLHQFPELSFQEEKSSAYIQKKLSAIGVNYKTGFAGTGILASIEGHKKGKTIALRADMDALPIREETGLEFASVNKGIMHACGHDMHSAILLGVIKVLNSMKEEIAGKVLFVFQPGEEMLPGGALRMMEDGLFDEDEPEAIIALHVLPEMETGNLGFKEGMYMASGDEIYIKIKGNGGHAALPFLTNDTVLAASALILNLQQIVSRRSDPKIPSVLSFGKFIAEGATNVIPKEVFIEGTFRTFDEDWRLKAHRLIESVVKSTVEAYGLEAELEIKKGYPTLYNNPTLTQKLKSACEKLLGADRIETMDLRMTTEDFGWFAQKYTSCFYRLGAKSSGNEGNLHSNSLILNEDAIEFGIKSLVYSVLSFFD